MRTDHQVAADVDTPWFGGVLYSAVGRVVDKIVSDRTVAEVGVVHAMLVVVPRELAAVVQVVAVDLGPHDVGGASAISIPIPALAVSPEGSRLEMLLALMPPPSESQWIGSVLYVSQPRGHLPRENTCWTP